MKHKSHRPHGAWHQRIEPTICTQCGKPLGEFSIIMPTTNKTRRERCVECAKKDRVPTMAEVRREAKL